MITSVGVAFHLAISLRQAADGGQVVSGIASVAAIAGVWFLYAQVRQQAKDGKVELITGMTSLITDVGRAFIDYPEMRKYFYEDQEPSGRDSARASAIAVALAGAMDHVAAHFDTKAMDTDTQDAWRQYFRDVYKNSSVFRNHLQTHRQWYGPKFLAQFDLER